MGFDINSRMMYAFFVFVWEIQYVVLAFFMTTKGINVS